MNYKPQYPLANDMLSYFLKICDIPHESGNEAGIADFLVSFAVERALEAYRDSSNNVIIYKPAQLSECSEPVVLQCHSDMVCEKAPDSTHDFGLEGIRVLEEGGILRADGTTLGADNGIGAAIALAILASADIAHPPLECVFTACEEIGLLGAQRLDPSKIRGRTMINLDSEQEGIATVSCAGGRTIHIEREAEIQPFEGYPMRINVDGLRGGHSGMEAHRHRASAIKLMGRILKSAASSYFFTIRDIFGGSKDNAIPRECHCTIIFQSINDRRFAADIVEETHHALRREYGADEPQLNVSTSFPELNPSECFTPEFSRSLINLIYLLPDGVIHKSFENDFVVASSNIGKLYIADGKLTISIHPRSSEQSLLDETERTIRLIADMFDFRTISESGYPGWGYAEISPIRNLFTESYSALFGGELKCMSIHAGLECGVFAGKLSSLDAIAIGPDISGAHTPEEQVSLPSCEKVLRLLVDVLSKM